MTSYNNFAHKYISDVPLAETKVLAFCDSLEHYRKVLDFIFEKEPNTEDKVSFDSDYWDFSPYFEYSTNRALLRFDFSGFPLQIRKYVKLFAIYIMAQGNKPQTAQERCGQVRSVICGAMEDRGYASPLLVGTKDIEDNIFSRKGRGDAGDISASTKSRYFLSAAQFYAFLDTCTGITHSVEADRLEALSSRYGKLAEESREKNKIPDIPAEYFDRILSTAVGVMRNKKAPLYDRMTAAMIVITTQTGFRISDLLILRTGDLNSLKIDDGRRLYFIHYRSQKTSAPYKELNEAYIFSSAPATEAFEILKRLRKKVSFSKETDYLYIKDTGRKDSVPYPTQSNTFMDAYETFFVKYLRSECLQEWEGISPSKYCCGKDHFDAIWTPTIHQYRVHLVTFLYGRVDLEYIRRFMNHLTRDMTAYYVRPKDTFVENRMEQERMVHAVVEEGADLMGGDGKGDDLSERIRAFIENGHFNVQKDINAIIESMRGHICIRAKVGGVCIKVDKYADCAEDAGTSNYLCAYGVCPNLYYMYYMVDITVSDFHRCKEIIAGLQQDGASRQALQKEKRAIGDLIRRKLLPLLQAMDDRISALGLDEVLRLHPNLLEVISDEAEIRAEITEWLEQGR